MIRMPPAALFRLVPFSRFRAHVFFHVLACAFFCFRKIHVVLNMFPIRKQLKVLNLVVPWITINVVDVVTIRNRTIMIFPNDSVQFLPFALKIPAAKVVPFTLKLLNGFAYLDNAHDQSPRNGPNVHNVITRFQLAKLFPRTIRQKKPVIRGSRHLPTVLELNREHRNILLR